MSMGQDIAHVVLFGGTQQALELHAVARRLPSDCSRVVAVVLADQLDSKLANTKESTESGRIGSVKKPTGLIGSLWRWWHDTWNPASQPSVADRLHRAGVEVVSVADLDAPATAAHLRRLRPDLAVILSTANVPSQLAKIPRIGTLSLSMQQVDTDERAATEIGSEDSRAIRISWLLFRAGDQTGSCQMVVSQDLPLEPFETVASLGVKTSMHAVNLCREAVSRVVNGTADGELPVEAWSPSKAVADLSNRFTGPLGEPTLSIMFARRIRFALFTLLIAGLVWYRRRLESRGQAPVIILTYHGIGNAGENHNMLPLERFHDQITYVRSRFPIVSLAEAVRRLREGVNNETVVVLTFDDGYTNCHRNLLPYLTCYGIPSTHFVCPRAAAERTRYAHDLDRGFTKATVMNPEQLCELREQDVEIGSHGHSHENMAHLTSDELQETIADSRRQLERMIGHPVRYFAFPFGRHSQISAESLSVARENYDAVFSMLGGYNSPLSSSVDHFQRITAPVDLDCLIATVNGFHRLRPFYSDDSLDKPLSADRESVSKNAVGERRNVA